MLLMPCLLICAVFVSSVAGSGDTSLAGEGTVCNGRGTVAYRGPNNRTICGQCRRGWTGLDCNTTMSDQDYGPERPCTEIGFKSTCDEGMQCADIFSGSCTCDFESAHPHCQQDVLTYFETDSSCAYAGCPEGMKCGRMGCECLPFSNHPLCQCSGTFIDEYTGETVDCKMGADGFCAPVDQNSTSSRCSYTVSVYQCPGSDACPPGKAPNNLLQCVCLPLSIHPDCLGNPSPKNDTNNICGSFSPSCKLPYDITYAVYKDEKLIAEGNTTVKPLRNYLIVSQSITAEEEYEICASPVDLENWEIRDEGLYDCARMDGTRCCKKVTASRGSTNFTNGCAFWAHAFVNTTLC